MIFWVPDLKVEGKCVWLLDITLSKNILKLYFVFVRLAEKGHL